jgi:uncharacterized membrane protein
MHSKMRIGSHPIHPMLIPFPFALWTTGVALDVLFAVRDMNHDVSYYFLLVGCVAALVAAVPGAIDYLGAIPAGTAAKRTGLRHGLLNVTALALFAASLFLRPEKGVMSYSAYAAEGLAFLILMVSGWLGGTLVYDHKVGVPDVPVT